MKMEEELWRDIPGYEGLYQVSNNGKVKSLGRYRRHWKGGKAFLVGKQMSPAYNKAGKGYYQIILKNNYGESKLYGVHQLIMIAFVGPQNGKDIDHINGISTDNRLENLEYVSHRENVIRHYTGKAHSSKYVGVSLEKRCGKWHSYAQINGKKRTFIGSSN